MPKALIGSPEPPLPRLCSGGGSWRIKTTNETGDFSCAFLSQTANAPLEVERNGSPQRDANPRGESQDHGASRLADRPLCRTQIGDDGRARGTRQGSRGRNRESSARKGSDREMGGCGLGLAAQQRRSATLSHVKRGGMSLRPQRPGTGQIWTESTQDRMG